MSEHGHSHGTNASARQLTLALLLTGTFLVVEVVYGFLAIRIGQRAADKRRTFGYRRTEILPAVNAGALFAIGLYILFEAYRRLRAPVEVQTTSMLIVAVLGLVVNLISARILVGGSEDSLNVKSAHLEVMGDLLGSVAVIVGALLIRFTGLTWIDPVLGALIGLWVLPRTWTLLRASVNVLLEGVPEGLDLDALRIDLAALPGVTEVHDLHVWSVTSGEHNLTAHLVVNAPRNDLLTQVHGVAERHGIEHSTVQIEPPGIHAGHEGHLHP